MQKFLLCLLLGISTSGYAQAWKTYIPYNQNGLWGYADTSAKVKIKPFTVCELSFFDENGLAFTTDTNGKKGVINRQMKTVLSPRYLYIDITHGRYIRARVPGDRFSLFNKQGIKLLPFESEEIMISERNPDYVLVFAEESVLSVYRFDAKLNKLILLRKHTQVLRAGFKGRNTYTTTSYKPTERKEYDLASGKTPSNNRNDEFDDEEGMWDAVPVMHDRAPQYETTVRYAFSDSLAKTVVYDAVYKNYHNPNLQHVRVGKKWGVVSLDRKVIVPIAYDSILTSYNYSSHNANNNDKVLGWICRLNGRYGIRSTDTNKNIAFHYDRLTYFSSKFIMAKAGAKYGVLNHRGDTAIAFDVDSFKYGFYNDLDWTTCSDELIMFAVKDGKLALRGTKGGKTDYVLDYVEDVKTGLYATGAVRLKSGNLYGLAICYPSGFQYQPCRYSSVEFSTTLFGYRYFRVTLPNGQSGYVDHLGRRYFTE